MSSTNATELAQKLTNMGVTYDTHCERFHLGKAGTGKTIQVYLFLTANPAEINALRKELPKTAVPCGGNPWKV